EEEEEEKPLRPKKSAKKAEKALTPEQEKLRDILSDITGTKNSVLLDKDCNEVHKVTVKELAEYLKGNDVTGVNAIVYDGVVSQNLIDIASGKGIPTLVCKRKGKISKLPADVTVWTREDLV
ncbi:MAG: DNA primase, partial [Methanomethylophilus sp.]